MDIAFLLNVSGYPVRDSRRFLVSSTLFPRVVRRILAWSGELPCLATKQSDVVC